MYWKELMLTKPMVFASALFTITGIFLRHYKFKPGVYNGCHYFMKKAISFTYVDIVTIKGNYYIIHFLYMSKYEAINLLRNDDLAEKSGTS